MTFFVLMSLVSLCVAPLVFGPSLLVPAAILWTLYGLLYWSVVRESPVEPFDQLEMEAIQTQLSGKVYYMVEQEHPTPDALPQVVAIQDLGWYVYDSHDMWVLVEKYCEKDVYVIGKLVVYRTWMEISYRLVFALLWLCNLVMLLPVSIPDRFKPSTTETIRFTAILTCVGILVILFTRAHPTRYAVAVHRASPIMTRVLSNLHTPRESIRYATPRIYLILMAGLCILNLALGITTLVVNVLHPIHRVSWVLCYVTGGFHLTFYTFWTFVASWRTVWESSLKVQTTFHPAWLVAGTFLSGVASILYVVGGAGDQGCIIAALVFTCILAVVYVLLAIC